MAGFIIKGGIVAMIVRLDLLLFDSGCQSQLPA
jgi:hypothetical protein